MKQNKSRLQMRKKSYMSKDTLPAKAAVSEHAVTQRLLRDIRRFIHEARSHISYAANASLVALYWRVGDHIRREVLLEQRAEYGKRIVHALSTQLQLEYGRGFSRSNIFNMIRFAEVFPDSKIVQTLSGQLGWSHVLEIIYLPDELQRNFYAEMCRLERWSVRSLRATLRFLPVRSASRWIIRIIISICSFSIAGCAAWWQSTLSLAVFKPQIRGKWSCICVG
jgi:hypothetical protein